MKSKSLSIIIILFIYLLASILGIFIYSILGFSYFMNLLIADIASTIFVFIFSIIFKNASIYDPYWSVCPMVVSFGLFFTSKISLLSILVLVAINFWSIRLTYNWAYGFKGLEYQDWRYTKLKEEHRLIYPFINFFGIHLFPTLVVYFCMLPFVYMIKEELEFSYLSLVGFSISVLAVILQMVADYQMHKYRKGMTHGLINIGLWKYSRHPNYLGEIMMWYGIAFMLLSIRIDKWYLILGAIINMFMFLFISIPLQDKRQSKKDGYEEYKRRTRSLFPIPRKEKNL